VFFYHDVGTGRDLYLQCGRISVIKQNRMDKEYYYLGIDGGATKTAMALTTQDEIILAEVRVGKTNLHTASEKEIREEVKKGVTQLYKKAKLPFTTKLAGVAGGFSGLDTTQDLKKAKAAIKMGLGTHLPASKYLSVVNDTIIGYWSGSTDPNGVGVIGGTGSNCYARNGKKEAWASGMDFILADQGSGYAIGLQVLKSIVKAFDGRGADTVLTKMILKHFKVKKVPDLIPIVYADGFGKRDIGALARYVEDAVKLKDKVAKHIANEAVEELVLMVSATAKRVSLGKKKFDVVMIGGLLQRDPYISKTFKKQARAKFKNANPIVPDVSSVMGAVRLAKSLR